MHFDPATIVDQFSKILLKLTIDNGAMLVLVLDGIDMVTDKGEDMDGNMDWFPVAIPSQVRIVMSCREGKALNALRRKRARCVIEYVSI